MRKVWPLAAALSILVLVALKPIQPIGPEPRIILAQSLRLGPDIPDTTLELKELGGGPFLLQVDQADVDVVVSITTIDGEAQSFNTITEHVGPEFAILPSIGSSPVTISISLAPGASRLRGEAFISVLSMKEMPNERRQAYFHLARAGAVGNDPSERAREEAIGELAQAAELLAHDGSTGLLAFTHFRLGLEHYWILQNTGAIEHYEKSAGLYATLRNGKMAAILQGEMGATNLELANFEVAIEQLRGAIASLDKARESRSVALLQNYLGLVFLEKSEFDSAISYFDKAILRFAALEDVERTAQVHANIALVHEERGDAPFARTYYRQILDSQALDRSREIRAIVYSNLANAERQLGNVSEAIRLLDNARELQQGIEDYASLGLTLETLAQLYRRLGDNVQALEYQELAVESHRNRDTSDTYPRALVSLAQDVLTNSALNAGTEGLVRARALANHAATLTKTNATRVRAHLVIAKIEAAEGKEELSLKALDAAQKIAAQGIPRELRTRVALHLAESPLIERVEREAAARLAHESSSKSQNLWGLLASQFALARLATNFQDSMRWCDEALKTVEDIRAAAGDPWLTARLGYLAYPIVEYQLQRIISKRDRSEEDVQLAFLIAKKNRARSLAAALAMPAKLVHQQISQTALNDLAAARTALYEARRMERGTSGKAGPRTREQLRLLNELRASIFAKHFPAASRSETRFDKTFGETSAVLSERGIAQLLYFVGQDNSYAWLVRDGELSFSLLPGATEISSLVASARRVVTQPSAFSRAELLQTLSDVAAKVLPEQVLSNPPKKMIVTPDGPLSGLAFDALVLRGPKTRYLASDVEIVISDGIGLGTPSAISNKNTNVVVIAPDESLGLGGAQNEAGFLRSNWPSMVSSIKASATKPWPAGLNEFLSAADVVHIPSHGWAHPDNWQLSFLQFSDSGNRQTDLLARDVLTLDIDTDLVFLSACDTGKGEQLRSEGTLAFSRAFHIAGARNVIATMWKVPDAQTKDLVASFYDNFLNEALPASVSLQRAKVAAIESGSEKSHPYYWSGAVLMTR